MKFTPPGGQVTVASLSAADGAQSSVSDTGIGVAPDERDHIFDRFWRSPDAVGVGGTGVGLAVVLRLVTAHHGAVDIASRPGGGTVFTVRLPREARRSRSPRAWPSACRALVAAVLCSAGPGSASGLNAMAQLLVGEGPDVQRPRTASSGVAMRGVRSKAG